MCKARLGSLISQLFSTPSLVYSFKRKKNPKNLVSLVSLKKVPNKDIGEKIVTVAITFQTHMISLPRNLV